MIFLVAAGGFGLGFAWRWFQGESSVSASPIGYNIWPFKGIERLPVQFLRTFARELLALGVDPNAALSVMKHESNFDPQAKNIQMVDGKKKLIAAGLIQWIQPTAKAYGTNLDALLQMDVMGQLPFVIRYWETMAKTFPSMRGRWTPEQALRAVFFPSSVGKPDSMVIGDKNAVPVDGSDAALKKARFIQKIWEQNKGLDKNSDGKVTAGEVDMSAKSIYAKAKSAPYIAI